MTTRGVMQLDAIDFRGARDEGLVCCVRIRRGRKGSKEEKQAVHSQGWKRVKNTLHGELLVWKAHYTRIAAASFRADHAGVCVWRCGRGRRGRWRFCLRRGERRSG